MNLKVRFKNPVFIAQLVLAILGPIVAYFGITYADLSTWPMLGDTLVKAVLNPYVVGTIVVSVWQTLNDPTTKGLGDSQQALTYTKPK
jgi:phi LC3 family holin